MENRLVYRICIRVIVLLALVVCALPGVPALGATSICTVGESLSKVYIETEPNGSGTLVLDQSLTVGTTITVYAVKRDGENQFISNIEATWSLSQKSGGVLDSDLVPAPDGKSANFTGHATGTAIMQATTNYLEQAISGLITITESGTSSGGGGGGGGGGITQLETIDVNYFNEISSFQVDGEGIVQEITTITSPDTRLTVTIPQGTRILDKNGNPFCELTAEAMANPPPPPADGDIIGLAYDFEPDGATFEPPIIFTFSYDPPATPESIAYYDATEGKWVELPCIIDTVNHTITASVAHFTNFAVIGVQPAPVTPAPIQTPAPTQAPTPTQEQVPVTPAPTQEQAPMTPAPTQEPVPTSTATPAKLTPVLITPISTMPPILAAPINWWLLGGLVTAIIIIIWLIIYLLSWKRRLPEE